MDSPPFVTQEGAVIRANRLKTALVASKLRLCKAPFKPTIYSVKADFVAAECDFDGYTAGGFALAAWTGPTNGDAGGSEITSPLVALAYGPAGAPPVGNNVSAWWIENAAGGVELAGYYDPIRPMSVIGNGWPFVAQDIEGKNPTPTV